MLIGVPRETKRHEYRVSIVPEGVSALVAAGHPVIIQEGAGEGSGYSDDEYRGSGAQIESTAETVYEKAGLIVKVKEPQPPEYSLFHADQILFAYLHLAAAPELTGALVDRQVVGIAYETVQLEDGSLPLLASMSEAAGKMSVQLGARWLEKENGGSGVLLGGVAGAPRGNVVVVGGGTVGENAAKTALGMGALVTILDIDEDRLKYLEGKLGRGLRAKISSASAVEEAVGEADLVIGAVLIPGARAPKVITKGMMARMRGGSVVVDVAIDQGGCVEGSLPTTLDDQAFRMGEVTLCCVANLPAAVARTSTQALAEAVLPYVFRLADLGAEGALAADPALRRGLNVHKGKLVNLAVAEACGMDCSVYVSQAGV